MNMKTRSTRSFTLVELMAVVAVIAILDQVVKAGLDTLITGEADYPTEVKARELGRS